MSTATLQFTPAEAAAFTGVPEREVRKEFEHHVFPPADPPRLSFAALVYLRALARMGLELGVKDRTALFQKVKAALAKKRSAASVEVADLLALKIRPVVKELRSEWSLFRTWEKTRVVKDASILAGEPVFRGTRLAIRHIGGMLERGESPKAVREDYPKLSARDLACARLFVRAYPRVGRPPDARQAPAG
ncbi:MAG: DUF433 domain-containing protein, partial [Thaumarchaeota archaeon]|nr:DUF433 domain-containing protein [Nitrososphaerota archaeon]